MMFNKTASNISLALFAFLSATTVCQFVIANPLPQDFRASYTFTRNGMHVGEVKRSLRAANDGMYIYESVSEATGFISLFINDKIIERSTWAYVNDKPQPLQYTYIRSGGKKKRNVKLSFDWAQGIVINTINDDPWQMPVPPDTQDKLVYQLTLMLDLRTDTKKLHYTIADGGKLKDYAFTVVGEETVDTPLGKLRTTKIQRVDDKRNTTIWCANTLNYLPVRIEQEEKGQFPSDHADQECNRLAVSPCQIFCQQNAMKIN